MTPPVRTPAFYNVLATVLILLFLFAGTGAQAQAPAWQLAVSADPSSVSRSYVRATAVDGSGNVYLAGTFQGTVSFGSATITSNLSLDGFVAKWNPVSGSFVWAQAIGGSSTDEALGIAVSGASVYVVGHFASPTVVFGNIALARTGTDNVFVAKLTDAGSPVWARQAGGTGADQATAVAVSGANVYVAGTFDSGSATFGTTILANARGNTSNSGYKDVFLAKLTDAGATAAFAWAYRAGGTDVDEATGIAANGTSVYITGSVLGFSATFGSTTLPIDGTDNVFIAKLTDAGSSAGFTWAKKVDAQLASGTAVAVNGTSVYLAGVYRDYMARFDDHVIIGTSTSGNNAFVAKLTDAGSSSAFAWALPYTGITNFNLTGLAVSGTGVYLGGGFYGTATFGNLSLDNSNLTSGAADVFVAKITDAGPVASFVWAQAGGGSSIDAATALAISGTTIYAGGSTIPPSTFSGHVLTGPFSSNGCALLVGLNDPTLTAPAPSLTGFSPSGGVNGDAITLTGTNLMGTTLIGFAGSSRNLVTSGFTVNTAGTQITGVVVPPGAVTGPISATTAGGTSTSGTAFTVNTAQLAVSQNSTVYPPQSSRHDFGNQVINTSSAASVFTLSNPGAATLQVSGASTTGDFAVVGTPTASIPPGGTGSVSVAFRPLAPGARTGTLVLTSTAAGYPSYAVNLSGTGTLPVPVGVSFSPASGLVGGVVSLAGTGLANASALTFAGSGNNTVTSGFVVNAAGTQITNIVVPTGAVTGGVTVTTPGGTSAGVPFSVLVSPLPTLASVGPATGPAGTVITATGANFTGAFRVNFSGGTTAVCTGVTSTTLTARVPAGALSGPVTITTPLGTSNGVPFGVPPVINFVSPGSGYVGRVVTVRVTSGTTGITAVALNGVSVPFSISSLSDLTFTVLPGATSGYVTVTTAVGTSAGQFFSVLAGVTLASVAPGSGLPGSGITLTGSNLAGVTAVVFTGTGINTVTSGFAVNAAGTQITGVVVPPGAQTGPVTVLTTLGFVNGIPFTVGGAPAPATPAWQRAAGIAATYGGSSGVTATAADASGNVFVAGYFTGTLRLGTTNLVNAGSTSGFVAKWSPASNQFVWAVAAGGAGTSSYTYINALAVSGNNVYAAGGMSGSATAFGAVTLTNAGPPLTLDAFVAKLTDAGATGAFVWAQRAGGTDSDNVASVAVDGASIYLAGSFGYNIFSNTPGAAAFGSTVLTSAGMTDAFVAKLADNGPTGTFVWAQRAGDYEQDAATGVAVSSGTVYLAGRFSGPAASFGSLAVASRGPSDGFIAKLTDAGATASFAWVQPVGGDADDAVHAVAVAGTSVYAAGVFTGPTSFGNTTLSLETAFLSADVFVAKLTDAGSTARFAWALSAASPNADAVSALALDGADVYIAGSFADRMRFGTRTLASAGNEDVFVAKVTDGGGTGTFAWAQQGGSPSPDGGQALATSGGSVYVGGNVTLPASFGALLLPNPTANGAASMGFLASISALPLATTIPVYGREALDIYPNPARGTVTLRVPLVTGPTVATATLTDMLGRTVRIRTAEITPNKPTLSLNLEGLASGVYMILLRSGTVVSRQQLIME